MSKKKIPICSCPVGHFDNHPARTSIAMGQLTGQGPRFHEGSHHIADCLLHGEDKLHNWIAVDCEDGEGCYSYCVDCGLEADTEEESPCIPGSFFIKEDEVEASPATCKAIKPNGSGQHCTILVAEGETYCSKHGGNSLVRPDYIVGQALEIGDVVTLAAGMRVFKLDPTYTIGDYAVVVSSASPAKGPYEVVEYRFNKSTGHEYRLEENDVFPKNTWFTELGVEPFIGIALTPEQKESVEEELRRAKVYAAEKNIETTLTPEQKGMLEKALAMPGVAFTLNKGNELLIVLHLEPEAVVEDLKQDLKLYLDDSLEIKRIEFIEGLFVDPTPLAALVKLRCGYREVKAQTPMRNQALGPNDHMLRQDEYIAKLQALLDTALDTPPPTIDGDDDIAHDLLDADFSGDSVDPPSLQEHKKELWWACMDAWRTAVGEGEQRVRALLDPATSNRNDYGFRQWWAKYYGVDDCICGSKDDRHSAECYTAINSDFTPNYCRWLEEAPDSTTGGPSDTNRGAIEQEPGACEHDTYGGGDCPRCVDVGQCLHKKHTQQPNHSVSLLDLFVKVMRLNLNNKHRETLRALDEGRTVTIVDVTGSALRIRKDTSKNPITPHTEASGGIMLDIQRFLREELPGLVRAHVLQEYADDMHIFLQKRCWPDHEIYPAIQQAVTLYSRLQNAPTVSSPDPLKTFDEKSEKLAEKVRDYDEKSVLEEEAQGQRVERFRKEYDV